MLYHKIGAVKEWQRFETEVGAEEEVYEFLRELQTDVVELRLWMEQFCGYKGMEFASPVVVLFIDTLTEEIAEGKCFRNGYAVWSIEDEDASFLVREIEAKQFEFRR